MRRNSPIALWHLLSLDAPTVATLWTWFVARCSGVHLPVTALVSMFLAVWTLYAADRLLDARPLDTAEPTPKALAQLELRHHFHHRHRAGFHWLLLVNALLLAVMLPAIPAEVLRLYVILASMLFAWFLLIHTRLSAARRLPKEIAVGLFFPAAVFIPTVARRPDLRAELVVPAVLFAAVCSLNCLYLYMWEHPGRMSQAHWTTRLGTQHLNLFALLIATVSILLISPHLLLAHALNLPASEPSTTHAGLLSAACAASILFLVLLHSFRHRFSALHLRATADLALLTPLFFMPLLHRSP